MGICIICWFTVLKKRIEKFSSNNIFIESKKIKNRISTMVICTNKKNQELKTKFYDQKLFQNRVAKPD